MNTFNIKKSVALLLSVAFLGAVLTGCGVAPTSADVMSDAPAGSLSNSQH
ncbi:hypothetical protein [Leucothrix mucor]|jgi:hypothetical protein|nr:hypothetical protein [Leucothrix mucor]